MSHDSQKKNSQHKNDEQRKAYQRDWYHRNKAKIKAQGPEAWAEYKRKEHERNQSRYQKAKLQNVEYARRYRRENKDEVNARARAHYLANRDEMMRRSKQYKEKNKDANYARIRAWQVAHPEHQILYHAKRLINEQTGVKIADIPDDVAEAKVHQLLISRWAKDGTEIDFEILEKVVEYIAARKSRGKAKEYRHE